MCLCACENARTGKVQYVHDTILVSRPEPLVSKKYVFAVLTVAREKPRDHYTIDDLYEKAQGHSVSKTLPDTVGCLSDITIIEKMTDDDRYILLDTFEKSTRRIMLINGSENIVVLDRTPFVYDSYQAASEKYYSIRNGVHNSLVK